MDPLDVRQRAPSRSGGSQSGSSPIKVQLISGQEPSVSPIKVISLHPNTRYRICVAHRRIWQLRDRPEGQKVDQRISDHCAIARFPKTPSSTFAIRQNNLPRDRVGLGQTRDPFTLHPGCFWSRRQLPPFMETGMCEGVPTDVRVINTRACTSDSRRICCPVRLPSEHRPPFVWDLLLRSLNTLLHQGRPIYTPLMLHGPASVILGMISCTSVRPNKTGSKQASRGPGSFVHPRLQDPGELKQRRAKLLIK